MIMTNDNDKYLNEVKSFAKKIGKEKQFEEKLKYLQKYRDGECDLYLHKDFAPHSFEFSLVIKGEKESFLSGGLIYHGSHDNGGDGGAPTFSVNLNPVDGWAIHT